MAEEKISLRDKYKEYRYTCIDCDHEWITGKKDEEPKCKVCGSKTIMEEVYRVVL